MAKYRKKPVEVEAFEFGKDVIPNWLWEAGDLVIESCCNRNSITFNGMTFTEGEFIIRDAYGDIYSCRANKFMETYEKVENQSMKINRDDKIKEFIGSAKKVCHELDIDISITKIGAKMTGKNEWQLEIRDRKESSYYKQCYYTSKENNL